MKQSRNKKIIDMVLLLFFYSSAFIIYYMDSSPVHEISNQPVQTLVLLLFSFILSFALVYAQNPIITASLFLLSFILIMVNGSLQGEMIGMEVMTSQFLIYLLVRHYHILVNICCSVVVILGMGMTQIDLTIMGNRTVGPTISSVCLLMSILLFSLILFNLLRFCRERMENLEMDISGRERIIAHLTDANRDFQELAIDVEEESRIDERQRITREIHDITGYTLTGVSMMLEHAEDLLIEDKKSELNDVLYTAKAQTRKGHEEIRQSLKMLRAIDDSESFYHRILHILKNFQSATGVHAQVDFTNMTVTMNKLGESVIYRFLQEGLTNAFRHGKASSVSIMFFQENDNLVISLEDNGIGGEKIQEGIGLQGMKERVDKLKGTIRYGSTVIGFNLVARIPLVSVKGIDL